MTAERKTQQFENVELRDLEKLKAMSSSQVKQETSAYEAKLRNGQFLMLFSTNRLPISSLLRQME